MARFFFNFYSSCSKWPVLVFFLPKMSVEVNWEEQWALYAPGFKDGRAHVPLPNQKTVALVPGPGFGDFSHPTTQLMVEMMAPLVPNQSVFDIGCGSGILSIAAAKLGASSVCACDIDPEALIHAQKNSVLNHVDISLAPPSPYPIVLMNMIHSEQKQAWQKNHLPFKFLLTSGILASETKSYLDYARSQNWELVQIQERDGWLGCLFKEYLL